MQCATAHADFPAQRFIAVVPMQLLLLTTTGLLVYGLQYKYLVSQNSFTPPNLPPPHPPYHKRQCTYIQG
jgi:hypothetical protein